MFYTLTFFLKNSFYQRLCGFGSRSVKAFKIILQIMRKKKKKNNLIPSAISSAFATKMNKGQTTGARMECCDGMFLNMFIKMKLLNRQET